APQPGDEERLLPRGRFRVDEQRHERHPTEKPEVERVERRPVEKSEQERQRPRYSSMHSTVAPFSYVAWMGTTTNPLAFVSAKRSAEPCQGIVSAAYVPASYRTRAGR